MKILYLSAHSILEADEIKLFLEQGHEVFSLHGAYQNGQGDGKRPPLNMPINTHLHDVAMQCSRENIHPEIIAWADVIIIMHRTDWIDNNWGNFTGKKVILRTIGQCSESNERDIEPLRKKGLKIVRMSPTEATIPNYQGMDALIRFYKDEDEFGGYIGNTERVVNISQAMFGNDVVRSRGDHMNIDVFKKVTEGLNWRIYGPDNEFAGEHNGGTLPYDDMKNMMKFNRVYFYTGTQPSPYTLAFIEPFMTGMPVVSIGEVLGTNVYKNQKTWEINSIIKNGYNGFVSDSISELQGYIQQLLKDHALAKSIGEQGRKTAIELFGKQIIADQWKKFFETL